MRSRTSSLETPLLGLYAALLWPAVVFFFAVDALPKLRAMQAPRTPYFELERVLLFAAGLAGTLVASVVMGTLARRGLLDRPRLARAATTAALACALLAVGVAGATRPLGRGPTSFRAYLESLPTVSQLDAARTDRASPEDHALECGHPDDAGPRDGPPVVDRCCSWVSSDNPREATTPPLKTCSVHVHLGTETRRVFGDAGAGRWRVAHDEARDVYFAHDGRRHGVAVTERRAVSDPVYGYAFADAIALHGALHSLALLGLGCATLLVLLRARDQRAHRQLCAGREAILEADGRLSIDQESVAAGRAVGLAPGPVIILDGHVAPGAYRSDAELKGRVVADVRPALQLRADRLAALAHLVLVVTASPLIARALMSAVAPWLR